MPEPKPKDLRSSLARARDEWFESPEGKNCCIGASSGQYLRNRLERAFLAGWDAHLGRKVKNASA